MFTKVRRRLERPLSASPRLPRSLRSLETLVGWSGAAPAFGLAAALSAGAVVLLAGIILTPILLGEGRTVFDGIKKRYPLRLLSTRKFKSGNVVVIYEPAPR